MYIRSHVPRLFLAVFSIALAFTSGLVASSLLRIAGVITPERSRFGGSAFRFDSELGWAPVPSYRAQIPNWGMVTNDAQGFRSPTPDPKRDKILILGDSVAWGYGVDDNETLSTALQDLLEGRRLQVLNLAVAGYGPDQEYLWLKRNVDRMREMGRIRLVVLVVCTLNDLDDLSTAFGEGRLKPLFRMIGGHPVLTNAPLLKYSATNIICNLPIRGYWRWPMLHALYPTTSLDEDKRLMVEFLQRMREAAKGRGARFVVVLAPYETAEYPDQRNNYAWYKSMLKDGGYSFLEMRHPLYIDGVHLSPKGNQRLAREIYRQFLIDAH